MKCAWAAEWGRLQFWGTVKGFTLLEALIAISIISVLAVLLFPVGAQMIERGHSAKCMGNLKQLYVGIALYAAENNGRVPPAQDASPPAPGAQYWFRSPGMWGREYVAEDQNELKRILRCPSDKTPSTRNDYRSYGHTPHFLQHWTHGQPQFESSAGRFIRLGEVGRKVLLADGVTTEPFGVQSNFPPIRSVLLNSLSDRHNGNVNTLFGDGSVQSIPKAELLDNLNLFNIFSL